MSEQARLRKIEYNRRYRQENRAAIAERRRQNRKAQKERERGFRYRQENHNAISRRRADLRREKVSREGTAAERARNIRICHGANYLEWFALTWEEQGGCCYLCGDPLTRVRVVTDHDHACCRVTRSCSACRRGLACNRCNRLIGQAEDDPELLRRIADNLEAAVKAARSRIARKSVQLELQPPTPSEFPAGSPREVNHG